MLITEVLDDASNQLAAAGVTSPSVDSEWLACFILKISRAELSVWVVQGREFPQNKLEPFAVALSRRVAREPLQHITGTAAFRNLELEVGPGVFIPRPETESLVERAIESVAGISKPVVVDLCSGSGAIAIAIQTEVPNASVHAVELSEQAFQFLLRNFSKYGLNPNHAVLGDVAWALEEMAGGVDLVVSNPPYIPNAAVPVDLEVALHDPAIALYGGADGLDVIRVISKRAELLLRRGGCLLIEHAHTQAKAISELLLSFGWKDVVSLQDLAGKDRMIMAVKP